MSFKGLNGIVDIVDIGVGVGESMILFLIPWSLVQSLCSHCRNIEAT